MGMKSPVRALPHTRRLDSANPGKVLVLFGPNTFLDSVAGQVQNIRDLLQRHVYPVVFRKLPHGIYVWLRCIGNSKIMSSERHGIGSQGICLQLFIELPGGFRRR